MRKPWGRNRNTGERLATGVLAIGAQSPWLKPGLGKTRDTGLHRTARLADLVGSTCGPGPGKPSLGARANPRSLLSCGLSLATSTPPHITDFSEPLHSYPKTQKDGPETPAIKTAGGSASPKGEARRECAGKAKRSECRAREDYGWGWAGGVTKPDHATSPPTTRPTPAAARAQCADAQRASPPTTPHHTRGS